MISLINNKHTTIKKSRWEIDMRRMLASPLRRLQLSLKHKRLNNLMIIIFMMMFGLSIVKAATPLSEAGYRGFSYPTALSQPTGEKPESKLWFNDGFWWGILWSTSGGAHHIHRLDENTQDWIDTGVSVDDRDDSKSDTLWDGNNQKLYVVSHRFISNAGQSATSGNRGELYRYSYSAGSNSYSLDSGFPVEVNAARTETLVIEKDSNDRLWVTYTRDQTVYLNHSGSSDTDWDPTNRPFILPTGDNTVDIGADDNCSIATFNNNIGVMWSNQSDDKMYFSAHPDSASPTTGWSSGVVVFEGAGNRSADDHINLASLDGDPAGEVFAVTKTSESNARNMLLVCDSGCTSSSDWTAYTAYQEGGSVGNPTRPAVVIDTSNRQLYVFTSVSDSGRDIYYKVTDLDNIQFNASSLGSPLIKDSSNSPNNVTSTKQNLNSSTGLAALSATGSRYLHNQFPLSASPSPDITVTPISRNYGDVVVNGVGSFNFIVSNDGTTTLNVSSTSLLGSDSDQFNIDSGNGSFSLNQGQSQTVSLSFNPTTVGNKSATLRIASNDPNEDPFDVSLTGNGVISAPDITVTPSANDYGDIEVGNTVSFNVEIRNDGSENLNVSALSLAGSNPGEFSIDSGQSGSTLAPGQSQVAAVSFNPSSLGDKSAILSIPSNDPDENPSNVDLSGRGISPGMGGGTLTLSPSDDARVSLGFPRSNYGSDTVIRIRGAGTSSHESYLKFNVAGLTGTPTSAKLRLFVTDGSPDGGDVYIVGNSWDESTITAGNAPAISGSPIASAGSVINGIWIEIDITSEITGNGTYSFGMRSNSSNSARYSSKEGANPPELVIEQSGTSGSVTPTLSKSFNPITITSGGISTLTLTINNNGNSVALTGLSVSDNYPAAITNAASANASSTCSGGTLNAANGGSSISYTGGSVAAGSSCTISVNVTSNTVGQHLNTSGVVSSTEAPDSATASATLTVNSEVVAPTLSKSFNPTSITSGGISTLTLTINNNGNSVALTGLSVSDNYPAAITNAASANASSTCSGGTLNAANGGSSISYTGGSVAAGSSCTISVNVTSNTVGQHLNTSGVVSNAEAPDSTTASATLGVTSSGGGGGGTLTLFPSDDARVSLGFSGSNYGSDTVVRVRGAGTSSHESYLKFNVAGLTSIPTSAKLRLFVTDGSPDGGGVYVVGSGWDESTITGSNAPAISGSPIASSGSVTNGTWVEIDIASAITGNGTYSFGIRSNSSNSARYSSKEGTNPPELVIESSGIPTPDITVTPTSNNYGDVTVNGMGSINFTVRNDGIATLNVSGTSLIGSDPTEFNIDSGGSFSLTQGQTQVVSVSFNPTSIGGKSASLRIASNDPNEDPLDVSLTGNGVVSAPDITVTPSTHSYGDIVVGNSDSLNIVIRNDGSQNLIVSAVSLSGSNPGEFSIDSGGNGGILTPGQSQTVTVSFNPSSLGTKAAVLSIPSDDPDENPIDVDLSGTGVDTPLPGGNVTFEDIQAGGSSSATAVSTSGNVTGVSGDLYLATITSKSFKTVTSVTGLGLSWSLVTEQCAGRNQTGVTVWQAQGSSPTSSTVTANLSGAPTNATITVSRYSGVSQTDPIGNIISGNTNGVSGACSGGTDSNSYNFNLDTTTHGSVVFGAIAMRNKAHTEGFGYTEQVEFVQGSGGGSASVANMDQTIFSPSTVSVDGIFSSNVDYAVIGIEIKP